MTKTILTSYSALLCMAVVMTGMTTVHASEVTGTLSSDTSARTETTGNIEGTVSSGNDGSGGSRSNRSSGNTTSQPSGTVLGAQDNNTQTPRFPNAGNEPAVGAVNQTFWSTVTTFFSHIFTF